MLLRRTLELGTMGALLVGLVCRAHDGAHPSANDAAAAAALRLTRLVPAKEREEATEARLADWLTPAEREVLGTAHIRFQVNIPVRLAVAREVSTQGAPFWLINGGYRRTATRWEIDGDAWETWERDFPAGEIGLGVNALTGADDHYFILLRPLVEGGTVEVSRLYPGQLRLASLTVGARPWVDEEPVLEEVPEAYAGWTLIRTLNGHRNLVRLTAKARITPFPSSPRPDDIVLTWSHDPKTSVTVQWRTSGTVTNGLVAFYPKPPAGQIRAVEVRSVPSLSRPLVDAVLANDPVVRRHTAEVTDLSPGTPYVYRVGNGAPGGWSEPLEFTTAPAEPRSFSFVYMGDAQNGLDRWGAMARDAFISRPDIAFWLMAGDLVNRGNERDDWDAFFAYSGEIFARRPLVPVIGNHECQGGYPTMYLRQFAVPSNGPGEIEPGRAYAFEYSNALFVILDSNLDPGLQAPWLEEQLANSTALWKFVSYHHPAYSSAPSRDNEVLRDAWVPVFDRYHVDLALQGHDHAYLRTYPLKGSERVGNPADGTVYVVSVSGTKMYDQAPRPYTEVGFTKIPTYQVLDVRVEGNELTYRAFDNQGRVRDSFVIRKERQTAGSR
ncbi:MAG: metallophosphoesterase family protein [Verrucomicrobiales bacterium]|nr:metallophosphoesterase family protein [Verrucomicrobiales bacterium]